ncbi:hypothetical protein RHMOL_Rhmol13G0194200 [Rhododendron molle]|uniref:Uncharacterized protein n=1 Tax=Rhododendron molle TaxID=49168 RepID=A0ACC0L8X2_RHOML|nr:hypothetical protein RHMOL_Rhmol13G0194200 [Rhododendron molle]
MPVNARSTPVNGQSTPVNAGQRPVNAGQRRSTVVNAGQRCAKKWSQRQGRDLRSSTIVLPSSLVACLCPMVRIFRLVGGCERTSPLRGFGPVLALVVADGGGLYSVLDGDRFWVAVQDDGGGDMRIYGGFGRCDGFGSKFRQLGVQRWKSFGGSSRSSGARFVSVEGVSVHRLFRLWWLLKVVACGCGFLDVGGLRRRRRWWWYGVVVEAI